MATPNTDINNAPDYLKGNVSKPKQGSVADLLFDGSWCGHREESYRVFDIVESDNSVFNLQLPDAASEESFPIAVKAISTTTNQSFLIYNCRKHPSSWHSIEENAKKETIYLSSHCCLNCGGTKFKIAVGFEVPSDSDIVNDTSWFALATECIECGDRVIAFSDETA